MKSLCYNVRVYFRKEIFVAMLRVIAGAAGGRLLKVPRNWPGRPTGDRVKESLFNILGDHVCGSCFLDLYAGTGNVGIEALSRGAQQVYFVEKDHRAVKSIYNNLYSVAMASGACVMEMEVLSALKRLSDKNAHFDIVFLDPPYEQRLEAPTLKKLSEYDLIKSGGIVVVESSKREAMPSMPGKLLLKRQQRYGDTLLTFYSPL